MIDPFGICFLLAFAWLFCIAIMCCIHLVLRWWYRERHETVYVGRALKRQRRAKK